jgi:predicted enzyme related to lactoylglutathione lyase
MDSAALEKIKFMLLAQQMGRAVAFYQGIFGLKPIFVSDSWSELEHGGAVIALHGGHSGRPNPTGLTLQVADALEAAAQVEQHGGRVLEVPNQRPGDVVMTGRFADPEGNQVFLTQYLG